MARFLARANLSVAGVIVTYDQVVDLPPSADEVQACIEAGLLLPEDSDGSFAVAPGPRRTCCGG